MSKLDDYYYYKNEKEENIVEVIGTKKPYMFKLVYNYLFV
jgi:hypothetical protein